MFELFQGTKKAVEHESKSDMNSSWYVWNYSQRQGKKDEKIGNHNRDHLNYCIVENTEKSPGDLRRLDVTQTSVKDHQLKLEWKTHKK